MFTLTQFIALIERQPSTQQWLNRADLAAWAGYFARLDSSSPRLPLWVQAIAEPGGEADTGPLTKTQALALLHQVEEVVGYATDD